MSQSSAKYVIGTALVGAVVGFILRGQGGPSIVGPCMLIALAGLPLVGTLITFDDDLPGGWSNPDGTVRPPWLHWGYWFEVTARAAVSGFGFAVDAGWNGATPILPSAIGLVGVLALAWIYRREQRLRT